MANQRFNEMLGRHAAVFRELFVDTARALFEGAKDESEPAKSPAPYHHAGEFGALRELVSKRFLRPLTPPNLSIASGFIINPDNKTSPQCDIVVFDPTGAPFSELGELGPFYPVECVVAIGEIKSFLTKTTYPDAIEQLDKIQRVFGPSKEMQPFSFLLFEEFGTSRERSAEPGGEQTASGPEAWLGASKTRLAGIRRREYLSLTQGLLRHEPPELLVPDRRSLGHIKTFAIDYYAAVNTRTPTPTDLRQYVQQHSLDLTLRWEAADAKKHHDR